MAIKWLVKISRSQIPALTAVTIANGVYGLFGVALALFCRGIIDNAVAGNSPLMINYAIGMGTVILLAFAIRIFSNSLSERCCTRLEITYRNHVLNEMMKKNYAEIEAFHSGERMNRMFNDIQIMSETVTTLIPNLVLMTTKGICALATLFFMSPQFTVVFLAGGVLLILAGAIFRTKMKHLHKLVQEKTGIVRSFLQEVMESMLIIRVFSTEKNMQDKASALQEEYYRARMKKRNISIFASASVGLAFEAAYLCALILGAMGLLAHTMSYGTLTAILQLVGQVQHPFTNLSGILPRYYSMIASTERVMELEKLPDEPQIPNEGRKNLILSKIHVKDLSFSYGRTTVLNKSSFTVNTGDFISFSGLSGGGKSTLFLLLLGIYPPEQGTIVLEDKSGSHIPVSPATRNLFTWVPQGNHLFSGTLRENILFAANDIPEQSLNRAIELSCVKNFLNTLPEGLDTVIGERGYGLSEGQAQRVAIARALVSEAPVLLLDEVTSALDETTELQVLKNIASLREKTCFIVTHRKAAIDFCNRHLNIENGVIFEIS